MGNKNSSSVKYKSRTLAHHRRTECQQQNGHSNAVRNEPISSELNIMSSAPSKQTVLPKIALVTSITAQTLFAGDASIGEDHSSYKDAENERDENLFPASECSDSVNAPELPFDSNTLDSFYLKQLLDGENATTCSLSSSLGHLTSECLSKEDTWTRFYERTNEIRPEEIKLLRSKKKQKTDNYFVGKTVWNVGNGQRIHSAHAKKFVQLEYLDLEVVRHESAIKKTFSCGFFSKLYHGYGKSLSTTIFEANLNKNMPLKDEQLNKHEKGQNNLKHSQAKSQPNHHLNLSKSFRGHEVISKLLSSIDEDYYLKLLISKNDLNLLMSHVANYLLNIGAICPVEPNGKHEKFQMDCAYRWVRTNPQLHDSNRIYDSHFIHIEEHLLVVERLRIKNNNERKQLANDYRQKLRELDNEIAILSKEINILKSYLGQDSYPVVISSSDRWL